MRALKGRIRRDLAGIWSQAPHKPLTPRFFLVIV
jgi:hypothetical protein